jgi:toxin ParE1/3/4
MSRVRKKPAALRDLIANGRYIFKENPSAAERFLEAAEKTFDELAKRPYLGRLRHFQRRPGLRSWQVEGFANYLIFYRPLADGVEIYRVLHGARDLRRLLTRRRGKRRG